MKIDIAELRKEFRLLKNNILLTISVYEEKLEKIALLQRCEERAETKCTPEIAAFWQIPKLRCPRKELLNKTVYDILPKIPPKGSRASMGGVHIRLYSFLANHARFTIIGHLVTLTEEDLLKCRSVGQKTLVLLKNCLSWNDLALGMTVEPEIMDGRVNCDLKEFFHDISMSASAQKRLFAVLDRMGEAQIVDLLSYSRKFLGKRWNLDEDLLDIIEEKLKSIGHRLRPGDSGFF